MNKAYNDNRKYTDALDGLRFSDEAKARMVQNLLDAAGESTPQQAKPRGRKFGLPRVAAVGVCAGRRARNASERPVRGRRVVTDGPKTTAAYAARAAEAAGRNFRGGYCKITRPVLKCNKVVISVLNL